MPNSFAPGTSSSPVLANYGAVGSNYGAVGSNYGAVGSNYGAVGSNYGVVGRKEGNAGASAISERVGAFRQREWCPQRIERVRSKVGW